MCPVGAHVDHNLGKITGFAIDKGIHIAYHPKQNGVIELCSLQFDKRAQWHIDSTPKVKEGDCADYLRGATIALQRRYPTYKEDMLKQLDDKKCKSMLDSTKELIKWIRQQL